MNKKSVIMNGIFCENMKIIILLSSIALVLATQVNPPPRSVNVALETSFLFDPKDMKDNKSLVNNIRGFLDKLYKILGPQTEEKQFRTKTKTRMQEERRSGEFIEVKEDMNDNKSLVNNIQAFLGKLYKILGPQTAEKQFKTETQTRMQEERRSGEFIEVKEDMNDNKSLVNNIGGFLEKLYKMLGPQTAEKQFRTETKTRMQEERSLGEFVEIMQNIGQNFLNMTGPKIKEALDTIHVQVKNITEQKPQSMLSQVLPTKTQDIIKDLIDTWMHSKPDEIKILINSTVRENKPLLNTFARRMNTYYNVADVKKLNKILKKFRRYIDNNKDTTKIVKKLLHNTIFKKYDNLNESARAAVISDLKMLSELLFTKNSISENRRKSPSHDIVDKGEFPEDITYTALRRSIDEKIRDAKEENEDKKKTNNEAVVGNVELYLERPQNS